MFQRAQLASSTVSLSDSAIFVVQANICSIVCFAKLKSCISVASVGEYYNSRVAQLTVGGTISRMLYVVSQPVLFLPLATDTDVFLDIADILHKFLVCDTQRHYHGGRVLQAAQ